ncbi:GntR family transcriptional regulator [Mycobacterium yunnanensis]|nr:GntR family transcriptional regulator [Mycobacterium yunnanensis]
MVLEERDLVEGLSASRNTVRAVLQQLAREGFVTRETKNGTRATDLLLVPVEEFYPFEARLLECRSLGCPPLMRDRLHLPAGWTVLMVESLLLQNDLPLGIQVNYLALGEEQSEDIHVDDSDVIQILERHLGVCIRGSDCTISAVAADEQTAALVGVELGAPMICVDDVIVDQDGQPRALSHIRVRGDRIALTAVLSAQGRPDGGRGPAAPPPWVPTESS